MEIIQIHPDNQLDNNIVVALGNFDGLHLGHQRLIKKTVKIAKIKQLIPSVLMFTKHTKNILLHKEQNLLTSRKQKLALLEKMGIELIIEIEFSEIMKMSPENFVGDFLASNLKTKAIVVGYDYRFGYQAKGTTEFLISYSKTLGIDVNIISAVKKCGDIVSSTRIRNSIEKGDVKKAGKLLGRPFTIDGTVVHGKKLGKKMGYPTANIQPSSHYVVPLFGVYDTNVIIGGTKYRAATSIGTNPTLNETGLKIEAHIINFDQDIYNQEISLEFLKFIRPEIKFDTIDDLFEQIEEDTNTVINRNQHL